MTHALTHDPPALRPEAESLIAGLEAEAPGLDLRTDLTAQLTGSRVQGLADEHSDYDHLLIYAPLGELGVAFSPLPEQWHSDDRSQRAYRVDKYAQMLVGGNADVVLSAWVAPESQGPGRGAALTQALKEAARPMLITQQYVASCANHLASVCNDIEKRRWVREDIPKNPAEVARIEKMGSRARLDDKLLMHGVRMGLHALHGERTGERLPGFDEATRDRLMAMKRHELSWPETLDFIAEVRGALLFRSQNPDKPWQYDAGRARHLGRQEALRPVLRGLFRDFLGGRG